MAGNKEIVQKSIVFIWNENLQMRMSSLRTMIKKRIVISLILFRCAKRFILPQKTKTSEKRVRSFQSQNSTAQSHKMQYLSQFFFLYRSSLTIQYKNVFQRLAVLIANSKLVICVGKRRGFFGRL